MGTTYLAIEVPNYLWICIFMYINDRNTILLLVGVILIASLSTTQPVQAETGKGKDIFKVIMTIFAADKSKGDVVAIVTVNNGESSKVKFLDTDLASSDLTTLSPSTTNPAAGSGILEYVATFPNVTVIAGAEYSACVLTTKDLEPICSTGNNSPALRPEFVDLSLNATSEIDQAVQQENNGEDENED
jgi:hypothetical protein